MMTTLSRLGMLVAGCWLATGVAWADAPFPVPAAGGLVQYAEDLAVCSGDLDSCDVALDTCAGDLTDCQGYADFLEAQIKQCNSDLLKCQANAQTFPATGQTSCWDSSGTLINCAGTGQDGDIRAGAALSYTVTDKTIIDNNTQLEWMKQDDNGGDCASLPGSLDKDCLFTWDEAFAFVASLNEAEFAGYTDWRLPNMRELVSIVNYQTVRPPVSAEFDDECEPSCTVENCSCTAHANYWSSTSARIDPDQAWNFVFAGGGGSDIAGKSSSIYRVRAVRGGL